MSDPTPRRDAQAPNIFVSYRRADSPGHAGWLNASLKEHFGERVHVFMDFDAIDYGEDFVEVIKRAVESSVALIVVIGRQWASATDPKTGRRRLDNADDTVRLEVATALARNIRVIPVLVEGATMPTAEELPPDLAALPRRNAIEISDARFKFDVKRLIASLERVLPPPPPPPAADDRKSTLTRLPPVAFKMAGAALRLVVIALVVLVSFAVWRFAVGRLGNDADNNNRPVLTNSDGSVINNAVNNTRTDDNGNVAVNPSSPATRKPGRDAVQVVRVLSGDSLAHGFFTPAGYIVTFGGAMPGQDEVIVTWRHGDEQYQESAVVVRRAGAFVGDAVFLMPKRTGLLRRPTPIRLSTTLAIDEAVERYLGPDDRAPGRVLMLRTGAEHVFKNTLVTTRISTAGDAGAPVVDAQGRIVAMVVGGSNTQTFSAPVENLKLSFLDAF